MDLSSPISLVVSFIAIIAGIIMAKNNIIDFLDATSAMLVIVPTFCSMFTCFPASQMARMLKHMPIILGMQKYNPVEYVNTMSELAEKARSQGLLSLEVEAEQMEDPFIKSATLMVADATDPETVETRLLGIIDAMTTRHSESWALYDKGASLAPAFGMVGTLVGLIGMLLNLNFSDAGGVASLGANMSAALITTLYGSMVANMFFMPLGAKLRVRHQTEVDCKNIVVDGILAIQQGINPKVVKEMLMERLDPKYLKAMREE